MEAHMHIAWSWVRGEIAIGVVSLLLLIVPIFLVLRYYYRRRHGWNTVAKEFDASANGIFEEQIKYRSLLEWTFWPLLLIGVSALWVGIPRLRAMRYIETGNALCFGSLYPQAGVWYRKALQYDPDSALAHHGLGNVFLEQGKKEEAMREYEVALRNDPDNAIFHRDLAVLWLRFGNQDAAYLEYVRAGALDPQASDIHAEFARFLIGQGKLEEAVKQYRAAIRYSHDATMLHLDLANALLLQGKTEDALDQYSRFLSLNPDNARAQNNYGVLLYGLKRYPTAATAFRKATALDTQYAEAFYNLGRVSQKLGQAEEAIKAYRVFLPLGERSPDYMPSLIEANKQLHLLDPNRFSGRD
ncbi:MAG: hypothetical protein JWL77_258 [Chthonomonadaceae bacterium]|nr:hypothetical protein [Chthonomonadaceae bacterium]